MNKCELRKEPYEVPRIDCLFAEVEMGFVGSAGVGTTDPENGGDEMETITTQTAEATSWGWDE